MSSRIQFRREASLAPNYPATRHSARERKLLETVTQYDDEVPLMAKAKISYEDLVDGSDVEFGPELPEGAIVLQAFVNVTEGFDGDGDDSSTISLGLNTNTDLRTALAVDNTYWDATGIKSTTPVRSAATAIALTAARRLKARLTIVSTDTELEAGAADVYIEYVLPPRD